MKIKYKSVRDLIGCKLKCFDSNLVLFVLILGIKEIKSVVIFHIEVMTN